MRFWICVLVLITAWIPSADAQARVSGYFNGGNVPGWGFDSEYWVETGLLRWTPGGETSLPDGARCLVTHARNNFGRAAIEGYFNAQTNETLIEEMRRSGIDVYQVFSVQAFQHQGRFPAMRRHYRLRDAGGDRHFVEFNIGGEQGLVNIGCQVQHSNYLARLSQFDAFATGLRIEMTPPN